MSKGFNKLSRMRAYLNYGGDFGLHCRTINRAISVPASVIYYATYESVRDKLNTIIPDLRIAGLLAGSGVRGALVLTYSPAELFRTRIQASSYGPIFVLKDIYNMANVFGVSSLYRGMTSTIIRDTIFSGVYWYTLESFNVMNSSQRTEDQYTRLLLSSFLGGTTSGLVSRIN